MLSRACEEAPLHYASSWDLLPPVLLLVCVFVCVLAQQADHSCSKLSAAGPTTQAAAQKALQ